MNQHYVPVAYLKHFTRSDEHFYTVRPKFKYSNKPKLKHPNQVCYIENFYDYEELNDIQQRRFIEFHAFDYENDEIDLIVKSFQGFSAFIILSLHKTLIKFILSLKLRNISIRKFYENANIEEYLDKVIDSISDEIPLIESRLSMPFTEYLERFKDKYAQFRDRGNRPHKDAIIRHMIGEVEPMNEVRRLFEQLEPTIYIPQYKSDYFLASDNPGFTRKQNRIYNTDYSDFDEVIFPLTSKLMLSLKTINRTIPLLIRRRVRYISCGTQEVQKLNEGTTFNAENNIFCQDEAYLARFTNLFRQQYPEQIKDDCQ